MVVVTGSSIWLHKLLAASLLDHIPWEQQAVPLLSGAEKLWTEQNPSRGGPLCWGAQPVHTDGIRAILVKHTPINTAQAAHMRNQYIVIWSTLQRGFWMFINKTKQK